MGALAVLQVLHGRVPAVSEFQKSYWLVTYQAGFVRRGLGGELMRALGPATPESVLTFVWLTAWLPLAAIVGLLGALVASRRWPAAWVAVVIAGSPFVLDQLVVNRRPDQVGLLVLVPAVLVLVLVRRPAWALGLLGLLLGALVLIHEGTFLFYGSWLALAVLVTRTESVRRRLFWIALLWLPALAALAVSFVAGRVDDSIVATLTLLAQVDGLANAEPTITTSVLPFLTNTLGESAAFVFSQPTASLASAVVLGVVLVGVHLAILRPVLRTLLAPQPRWLAALAWAAIAGAIIFTFATGVDWPRWFSCFGTSALVVLAGATLSRDKPAPAPPCTAWVVLIVAAVLLAALPPLWEFPDVRQWAHLIPFGPYGK